MEKILWLNSVHMILYQDQSFELSYLDYCLVINIITWVVSTLIAVVLFSIAIFCNTQYVVIKDESIVGIATLLGTFGFTMTGFIAAIGAYIISVSDVSRYAMIPDWEFDCLFKQITKQ